MSKVKYGLLLNHFRFKLVTTVHCCILLVTDPDTVFGSAEVFVFFFHGKTFSAVTRTYQSVVSELFATP